MVAIVGGAIAAAGAIGGAVINSNASSDAAGAQQQAAGNANQTQWQMYNQTRSDQAPWRAAGGNALDALSQYYGLPGANPSSINVGSGTPGFYPGAPPGDPNKPSSGTVITGGGGAQTAAPMDYNKLISSLPGYQFQFGQGEQAVQRNLASQGLLSSGAGAKALTQYGQGYAQNAAGDYLAGLRSLAGLGQTSTQATGYAGTQAANQIGGNQIYAGNAAASGYVNQANAFSGGLQNLAGVAGYFNQPQPNSAYGSLYAQYGGGGGLSDYTGSGINPWTGAP